MTAAPYARAVASRLPPWTTSSPPMTAGTRIARYEITNPDPAPP
jgi:hypothetical protein